MESDTTLVKPYDPKVVRTLEDLATKLVKAEQNPGKLIKVRAGYYFLSVPGAFGSKANWEIEQINHEEPHPDNGWWIARKVSGPAWAHTDPYPTRRELLETL